MDKLYIDTDVVIDFLIDRMPFAVASSKLFDLADKGRIKLWISSLSVNNIHYVTRRMIGDVAARSTIRELLEIVDIQGVSKKEIMFALDSEIKDFEDAVQNAAALDIKGIKAIITRNTKDYRKSRLPVFTPEEYLKTVG